MHLRCHSAAQEQVGENQSCLCLSRLKTSARDQRDAAVIPSDLCKDFHGVSQVLHAWIQSCVRGQHPGVMLSLHTHTHDVCGRGHWRPVLLGQVTHQGVVQADVSLQTALFVFKLHNRHFGCCDGQNVPQTCGVGS